MKVALVFAVVLAFAGLALACDQKKLAICLQHAGGNACYAKHGCTPPGGESAPAAANTLTPAANPAATTTGTQPTTAYEHQQAALAAANGGTPTEAAPAATTTTEGEATITGTGKKIWEGDDEWLSKVGHMVVKKDPKVQRSTVHFEKVPNKFLLHTIEGSGGAGDLEGGTATLDPKRIYPHFILAYNLDNVLELHQWLSLKIVGNAVARSNVHAGIQIELGSKAGKPFTESQAELTDAVAALFAALHQVTNGEIPLSIAPQIKFCGEDQAYGEQAPCRMTEDVWPSIAGLVGHQHSPAPDTHWDPGAINGQMIVDKAKALIAGS